MNPDYCTCNNFEKTVDYNDICYYKAKEDSYNAITKDGWYIRDAQYNGPIASLKPWGESETEGSEGSEGFIAAMSVFIFWYCSI